MIMHVALLLAVPAGTGIDWHSGVGQFHYRWPVEVNSQPALRARLNREMALFSRDARRYLANEHPSGFYYHKRWRVAGNSGRLVSLTAEIDIFRGWLHDELSYEALLWDRVANRPVAVAAALGPAMVARTRRRCTAWARAEMSARLGRPVGNDTSFDCPALAHYVVAPADRDHNGRFETLRVLIAPYVIASYTAGSFQFDIPLRPGDLASIPVRYRVAFEARRRR
jgi:hypothetical protein